MLSLQSPPDNVKAPRKRSLTEDAAVQEIKFELTSNLFIVVCIFRNVLYVHAVKHENRYPTKEGVAMSSEEWRLHYIGYIVALDELTGKLQLN